MLVFGLFCETCRNVSIVPVYNKLYSSFLQKKSHLSSAQHTLRVQNIDLNTWKNFLKYLFKVKRYPKNYKRFWFSMVCTFNTVIFRKLIIKQTCTVKKFIKDIFFLTLWCFFCYAEIKNRLKKSKIRPRTFINVILMEF